MKCIRTFLLILALSASLFSPARIITDTLCSDQGDRIIVTYETTQRDNKVELKFKSVRKNLGDALRGRYGKSSEIKLLFFDRIEVIEDIKFTSIITPRAFSIPSDIGYSKSLDSYFFLDNQPYPSLSFEIKSPGEKVVSIPIYLAHYEGKREYKILYLCGYLNVKMGSNSKPSQYNRIKSDPQYQVEEIEETVSEEETNALNNLKLAKELLAKQESVPFEDILVDVYNNLQKQKYNVDKTKITQEIERFIEQYDTKKKDLEKQAKEQELAAQEQAQAQALAAQEEAERKADYDDYAHCLKKDDYEIYLKTHPNGQYKKEATEKIKELKNRNIWKIIGGVLLAILLFVGNQVLQSFRNIRTQRSMMQMQKDAENRAKNMARSKAQGAIRRQTGKAMNQARQKSKTAVHNAIDKGKNKTGNNKRISI
jgi:hypothetical protein